jgi:hypothetical protein
MLTVYVRYRSVTWWELVQDNWVTWSVDSDNVAMMCK